MKHLTSKDFVTTKWSGGETTELFIWPETANYKKRDFDFRLSTATVEVETSVFTPLEGVARTLMVLDGEMKLVHDGHHEIVLGPFDQDHFQGGWKTSSEGTCVDFNLMCQGKTRGELTYFELLHESVLDMNLRADMNLLYIHSGSIQVRDIVLNDGDLLVFDDRDIEMALGLDVCDFVLIEIWK